MNTVITLYSFTVISPLLSGKIVAITIKGLDLNRQTIVVIAAPVRQTV